VRQLDRQINSQFYEWTALSRNKAAMLRKGEKALPEDYVLPEEEIKDLTWPMGKTTCLRRGFSR
jgi:predicted nuclease of restriction endonuclease-like (RecB) superfamily